MTQVQPRTILAIGLPCSLLVNLLVAVPCVCFYGSGLGNAWFFGLIFGVVAWLFVSVPVLGAMALIRSCIGKFDVKRHQVKEAMFCWVKSVLVSVPAVFATMMLLNFFSCNSAVLEVGFIWALGGWVTLIFITGLNVVIRFFSKEPVT